MSYVQLITALMVKKLDQNAKLPVCANPGSDLGYDVFALRGTFLEPGVPTLVPTGVSLEMTGYGFLIRDRSSMAKRGIIVTGGVIDAGYRGDVGVMLTNTSNNSREYVRAGDKIAQLIPVAPQTHFDVVECDNLSESARGDRGFGSTGR